MLKEGPCGRLTNEARAKHAAVAFRAWLVAMDLDGSEIEEGTQPDGNMYLVKDLICNLLHMAKALGCQYPASMARDAIRDYKFEIKDLRSALLLGTSQENEI